jgi:hypothetical protein
MGGFDESLLEIPHDDSDGYKAEMEIGEWRVAILP